MKSDIIIILILLMGQAYCQTCCGERNMEIQNSYGESKTLNDDFPSPDFAKPVRQPIELNSKVKEVFTQNRLSHVPERKGTRLQLHYLFEYAAYYDGQWSHGLPHGFGRLIYDDGSIYEGCFLNGTAQCRDALFVKQNGSYYKGSVKGNKANGQGVLNSEKFHYKGNWLNDMPHGEGRQIYMKGHIPHYEGDFKNGRKDGLGIYYWNQKQYYSGSFKNNKIHGFGHHVTKEYDYEGDFCDGYKHGRGRLKNIMKKWVYEGEFKNNKMDGSGVFTWEDKTRFEGQFANNERKKGKLYLATGELIEQEEE